jgi:hypothetical protein
VIKVKCIEAGKWTVVRSRDRVNDTRNVAGDKSTGVRQTTTTSLKFLQKYCVFFIRKMCSTVESIRPFDGSSSRFSLANLDPYVLHRAIDMSRRSLDHKRLNKARPSERHAL